MGVILISASPYPLQADKRAMCRMISVNKLSVYFLLSWVAWQVGLALRPMSPIGEYGKVFSLEACTDNQEGAYTRSNPSAWVCNTPTQTTCYRRNLKEAFSTFQSNLSERRFFTRCYHVHAPYRVNRGWVTSHPTVVYKSSSALGKGHV